MTINTLTATEMPMVQRRTRQGLQDVPDFTPFVARGVDLLNTRVPGWAAKVDPKTLSLADPKACVVGQLAIKAMLNGPLDGYFDGIKKLFRGARNKERAAGEHGFNLPRAYVAWNAAQYRNDFNGHWAFDELTRLWVPQIRDARRALRAAKAEEKTAALV